MEKNSIKFSGPVWEIPWTVTNVIPTNYCNVLACAMRQLFSVILSRLSIYLQVCALILAAAYRRALRATNWRLVYHIYEQHMAKLLVYTIYFTAHCACVTNMSLHCNLSLCQPIRLFTGFPLTWKVTELIWSEKVWGKCHVSSELYDCRLFLLNKIKIHIQCML